MATMPAFRVNLRTVEELASFLDGFRADCMRIVDRVYTRVVASEAARRIDFHRVGLGGFEARSSPLKDAIVEIRRVFDATFETPNPEFDIDCEIRFHFVGDVILARFVHGCSDYLRLFSSRKNVRPYDWTAGGDRPDGVDLKDWLERERLWTKVNAKPRLGNGVTFRLIDSPLPILKWTAVKAVMPEYELRVRRTANALVYSRKENKMAPTTDAQTQTLKRWLSTRQGAVAYDNAKRDVIANIPKDIGRFELEAYGLGLTVKNTTPAPPGPIDHVDIMESADGRVFMAIMEAGFSPNERIYIQISSNQLTFSQNGINFGHVGSVPHSAIELLRGSTDATIVELRDFGDRKEIHGKYVALIRDTSLSDSLDTATLRWKTAASKKETA